MACTYCFYTDEMKNRSTPSYGMMSIESAYCLIDKALKVDKKVHFAFQGGEPTLSGLEFYKQFTAYAKHMGGDDVSFSLQTNGYNIDREWARFFHDNKYLIGLSMDGNKKYHDIYRKDKSLKGTFTRVFKTASYLKAEDVQFNILITVTNEVAKNIVEIFNFFKRNNFRFLQFIPCISLIDQDEGFLSPEVYATALKKLFDLYFDSWQRGEYISIRYFDNLVMMILSIEPENCAMRGVCGHYYVVEADGTLFPCDFYSLDRYKLGNIKINSFSELDEKRREIGFVEESYELSSECRECKYFSLCRGGCKRDRVDGLNYLCSSYKEFFNYALDRLKIIARAERKVMFQ